MTRVEPRRRWLRWVRLAVVGVAVALAGAMVAGYWHLRRSLPALSGSVVLEGLSRPVLVARDATGVPTIHGDTRVDVARAVGYVHAQDRFFQMDLARRRAAGELAELIGPPAVAVDRAARFHRLRPRARAVLESATAEERALIDAYTAGVNAGLGSLRAAPFEYALLRAVPQTWRPEDSALVLATMFFTLQDEKAEGEARSATLREVLPTPVAEFLDQTASVWDTPIAGDVASVMAPPGAEVFDLRKAPPVRIEEPVSSSSSSVRLPGPLASLAPFFDAREAPELVAGSNNWAVAGSRTVDGRAIVANDMHLAIGLPNIWYRASLTWFGAAGAERVTGATLPGLPAVAVGSNGHVAWGFTNTAADWSDRVVLDVTSDGHQYRVDGAPRAFERFQERIRVRGRADELLEVRESLWGPVIGPDAAGRHVAVAWVPQRPGGWNLHLMGLEAARTLEEALTIANESGIPAQNIVVGDASGRIAWTIAGRIPRRVGLSGELPMAWERGSREWGGWYAPEEYPRVTAPETGVLVTANNRLVGGTELAKLGRGDFDPGARARQIRDDLVALPKVSARDMLAVQLDDRAVLMARWRDLLLETLTDAAVAGSAARAEFRRLVQQTWSGRASVESVGYRLVRQFRATVAERAFAPFVARARERSPDFPSTPGRMIEGPAWALLTQKPLHLLDPAFADWNALMLDAVDRTIATLVEGGRRLDERSWGEANTLQVRHPLAAGIPLLGRWLSLPSTPLPGDAHVPRVQGAAVGASERFAVSPGNEGEGYFHMPGGQSGHPLSPHFRDGHEAWARGDATPFLPGPAVHTLTLVPAGQGAPR